MELIRLIVIKEEVGEFTVFVDAFEVRVTHH